MSEELENSVREMLKAETWTRAGISGFTKNNLMELAEKLEKIRADGSETEIKAICDEQLQHTKESIVALYFSGMISLREHTLENNELVTLVDIFEKNHKEQLVEYICETILDENPENIFALRKLADYYKDTNNDKVWDLYEKIIQVDFEEAEIAKVLAERYDSQGNKDLAITFFRKAILRYIATADRTSTKNIAQIKAVWTKLVQEIPQETDFFFMLQKKIAKNVSEDKSAGLMFELYQDYKRKGNWDIAIEILKLVLNIDPKEKNYRDEIVECYKEKYKNHSHLDEYIKRSNLNQSFRDVFEAINDFEKHIAFDAKNYVFHRSWGVGIIRKVQGDDLTIQFGKKVGVKQMKLEMAINALQPLSKDHIWVKKATMHKEELAKCVKADVALTLKLIIKSFDNRCDMKRNKAELVPSILSAGEWTSWHAKAENELTKKDSAFGVTPDNIDMYMVRDHEITQEERLNTEFKAEKDFFSKIDIFMRFANDDETSKSDESFIDMFNYFASFLKSESNGDEQVLAAYLTVQNISKKITSFHNPAAFTFEQLYRHLDAREAYLGLKDSKNTNLKADFIANVRQLADWDTQFVKLFPVVLQANLLKSLIDANKTDKVQTLVKDSFEDYRNNRDAVIYFFKEYRDADWFKQVDIPYEKQLQTIVNVIAYCYREIENHVNTTDNKKTIKNACALLFGKKADDKNLILEYITSSGEDVAQRMFKMVNDVKDLDYTYKQGLRKGILDKWPNFIFPVTEVKQEKQNGIYCTARMKEEKQKEAENIEKVVLPQIADEISAAREKGDLKENAEYISAKEAQHIQQENLKHLKNELARAVIFDPTSVTTSIVSFGTKVTVHDNKDNSDATYTILGPFESAPEQGIISYISPLGDKLLDSKVGSNLKFVINGREYDYTVKTIEIAKIN